MKSTDLSIRHPVLAAVICVASACTSAGEVAEPADLVIRNAKVVTVDAANPQAEAIAMTGDRITAVGSNRDIDAYIGSETEVVELAGQLVIPGFIEGHGHFMGLGQAKMNLDLTQVTNWDEIVDMVAHVAGDAPQDTWIAGRGWHQEKWTDTPPGSVDGVPTHESLSRVSPNNPVLLTHASGHAAFANGRALQMAGIDAATPDPEGGEIVHDAQGNPTGLLRETAQRLVGRVQARASAARSDEERNAEARRIVELAGEDLHSKGITSFHDAGVSFETIDFYRTLASEGNMPVRLYVMVRGESNEVMDQRLPEYRMENEYNGFLTVRSIKRQIDGALGSHGAWLLQPYEDMPTSVGLVLEPVEDIRGTAEVAIKHGYQVNTHAIGDRANKEVLDIYESVFQEAGAGSDLRWRIEHAQHLDPADVQRFVDLGVVASMQGVHATSDAPWVFRRLGAERAESGAYLWRSLIDAGVTVTNGTDVPVEDANPIASFYASAVRRSTDGSIFFPDERMTREEALASYTINSAYAAFEEDVKGSITTGKYADIVVLSHDILVVPEDEIMNARVLYTIVGGKIVFRPESNE